ncbi:hypothetical protein AB0D49_39885 [Streptomyces sp. NPDC048290]|uniref:hypothetical protein n=1 Tax=Streptomyces sp. NPDC048290 TaxID=3155811 RepID=UPI003439565D
MAVDQLPGRLREFGNYLGGLLARLDQAAGWCAVFWQRDPDAMRACLDGQEVAPWDVVEALLQDLATAYGPDAAAREHERARPLHTAALAARDARPGARDDLGDRLDIMLREQRYAADRLAQLGRALVTATSREETDALRLDLAWARDDHDRAGARCAELRGRIDRLEHTRAGWPPGTPEGRDIAPRVEGWSGEVAGGVTRIERRGEGRDAGTGGGFGGVGDVVGGGFGGEGDAAGGGFGGVGDVAGGRAGRLDASGWDGSGGAAGGGRSGAAAAGSAAAAGPVGSAPRQAWSAASAHPAGPAASAHPAGPAWSAWSAGRTPSHASTATSAAPDWSPPPPAPTPAAPSPPGPADTPHPPKPAKPKKRRGSARFAGMLDADSDAEPATPLPPTVVIGPPGASLEAGTEPPGASPRGARFAGATDRADTAPAPPVPDFDAVAVREVAAAVRELVRLRRDGRSGEAHALLVEITHWPAERFAPLAAELERARMTADWATLLWEAASLPAERLVAAADALVAGGRAGDGERILRQGVARPAAEIGRGLVGLIADGRRREVRVLLDAYVRVRTPEEAVRCAGADPERLVPLLLEAAREVSEERYWDLVHALRVAGTGV